MTTATRHQFPTKPLVLSYWEGPTGEPRIERRWVSLSINSQRLEFFYMGCCLHCGMPTFAQRDGTTDANIGNNGLIVLEADGKQYRACQRCGSNESRAVSIIQIHRNDTALTGPLVWPDNPAAVTPTDDAVDDDDGDPLNVLAPAAEPF